MNAKRKRTPVEKFGARIATLDSKLGANLNQFLPYWWENSLNDSPGASQQAIVSMARLLNLDLATVINESVDLSFEKISCCYKKTKDKKFSDLQAATSLIRSYSKTVSKATVNNYIFFSEPDEIRKEILMNGKPWVDFVSLVQYCWSHGVPVIFLPDLFSLKKMDAVVQKIGERPVIAIAKKCKYDSELLFLLAHEMGHIYHDHIDNNKVIIDNKVNEQRSGAIGNDCFFDTEKEANNFALSVITGDEHTSFYSNGKYMKGEVLATGAMQKAKEISVDPGHVALNWAHTRVNSPQIDNKDKKIIWAVAFKALGILFPSPNWKKQLQALFLDNIDEDRADEDQVEYLFDALKIVG